MEPRIIRALEQKMFLIKYENTDNYLLNFKIEGSTGTIYNIKFTKDYICCTCPDCQTRRKICKHIYFIFIRILKDESILAKINSLNVCIFDIDKSIIDKLNFILITNRTIDKNNKNDIINEILEENDCVICFEKCTKENTIDKCSCCKNYFHSKCIEVWLKNSYKKDCPLCRKIWNNNDDNIMSKFEKQVLL